MKKLVALILALLYMGTSTGATLHMHYCMGKLITVNLWHSDKDKQVCSKCGDNQRPSCAKKCCKDEHKTVKYDNDQHVTDSAMAAMQQLAVVTPVHFMGLQPVYITALVAEHPVSNAPPGNAKVPVHILHCTYRI
ncbi:hypothetical protein SAMN05444266_109372 [Chitinophaga jiangningensis]|uniref:Uncharacterized protein n=1 Tax=Chitinophaga jiangningensis TaxID=1419482 RepID=A0A1M7KK01_9BACT|nr:hypothetical protein [Chitinophaga jiangningensis]SHM65670.1 hypothetical protein SAMN05444266_109372 [Chitinophaga jiangningensis]